MTDPTSDRKKMIGDFLTQYGPRPITDDEADDLERPLTREEIVEALKQIKPGKSPGPDGLSVSYYKTFADTLIPQFLTTFNSLDTHPDKCRDLLEAHIVVLPKSKTQA